MKGGGGHYPGQRQQFADRRATGKAGKWKSCKYLGDANHSEVHTAGAQIPFWGEVGWGWEGRPGGQTETKLARALQAMLESGFNPEGIFSH